MLRVVGVYRWYENDDVSYPLFMVPQKQYHPSDTMVRQAAMTLKLVLLMYYKNGRTHDFHRRFLCWVEMDLLARTYAKKHWTVACRLQALADLASHISKIHGHTKITNMLLHVRVGDLLSGESWKEALNEVTSVVSEAGDMCDICQEKMQAPILLCCNHIFCEDCFQNGLKGRELAVYVELLLD